MKFNQSINPFFLLLFQKGMQSNANLSMSFILVRMSSKDLNFCLLASTESESTVAGFGATFCLSSARSRLCSWGPLIPRNFKAFEDIFAPSFLNVRRKEEALPWRTKPGSSSTAVRGAFAGSFIVLCKLGEAIGLWKKTSSIKLFLSCRWTTYLLFITGISTRSWHQGKVFLKVLSVSDNGFSCRMEPVQRFSFALQSLDSVDLKTRYSCRKICKRRNTGYDERKRNNLHKQKWEKLPGKWVFFSLLSIEKLRFAF